MKRYFVATQPLGQEKKSVGQQSGARNTEYDFTDGEKRPEARWFNFLTAAFGICTVVLLAFL